MSDITPTDEVTYWRDQLATRQQLAVYKDTFVAYLRDKSILASQYQFGVEPLNTFLNVLRWVDPRWTEVYPTGL